MNKSFDEALSFRHACKSFDTSKKITNENMQFILNAARLSPSSYGLETSKYIVITNEKIKLQIQNASMNQSQVGKCSHLVIVISSINDVKIQSGIPQDRFRRLNLPNEKLEFFLSLYTEFVDRHLYNDEKIYQWVSKQAYLSVGNMITAAAIKGIDSCPLEGFDKESIENILNLDTSLEQVSLVVPFGYRKYEQPSRIRRDFNDIVKYIH